jgi:hypothetical protein
MRKVRAILAGLLVLAACTTTGPKLTQQQFEALQGSGATPQTVIATFGKPTRMTQGPTGDTLVYAYPKSSTADAGVGSGGGAFAGSIIQVTTTTTLTFDQNGVLREISSADTAVRSGSMQFMPRP